MAKQLRHVIGTNFSAQFKIQSVDFDGVKTERNLTGARVYFELERDGVLIISKDSDLVGGVTITDAVNGVCVASIGYAELSAEPGGEVDYGLVVREDPTVEYRGEPIRGKMILVNELVNIP